MKISYDINIFYLITGICTMGTLTLAIISLNISIKNRRNPMRENVYNRQLEIYKNLFVTLSEIKSLIYSLQGLYETIDHRNSDYFEKDEKRLNELCDQFQNEYNTFMVFLPNEIEEEIRKTISFLIDIRKNEIDENTPSEISIKFFDLQDKVRDSIGLDKLTKENMSVINSNLFGYKLFRRN